MVVVPSVELIVPVTLVELWSCGGGALAVVVLGAELESPVFVVVVVVIVMVVVVEVVSIPLFACCIMHVIDVQEFFLPDGAAVEGEPVAKTYGTFSSSVRDAHDQFALANEAGWQKCENAWDRKTPNAADATVMGVCEVGAMSCAKLESNAQS